MHKASLRVLGPVAIALLAACTGQTAGSAPPPGDLAASIGPIDVPAGVETTQCIVVPLGNTQDIVMNGYQIDLAPGSHHMIVYMTTAAPTTDGPVNCSPFTGLALGTDVPIAFAGTEHVTWAFPAGVAIDIPANQLIKVEAHYINTTADDLQGHGTVTFHTTTKDTAPAYQPAGFAFYGTLNINIPPNSTASTGPLFQAGPAGTHMVSVTTHQHRLGTHAQVWSSSAPGDMSDQIANDLDWSNPAWKPLAPTVDFNGTNGLTFECEWTNTTNQTVSFGESALDEMCFTGGYIYPSSGLDFCVDGGCRHRH